MLCSEMFPIKETNDLQGAALYGIWSNGAERVNPSQKRRCQARKQGVENWRFLPPPSQLKPLPPSLRTISLIWHSLFPKKLQILYCKVFWMRRCNKIPAIYSYPLTPDAASFKMSKIKKRLESFPSYSTKVRCPTRAWIWPGYFLQSYLSN